jgi:hypothetical protein
MPLQNPKRNETITPKTPSTTIESDKEENIDEKLSRDHLSDKSSARWLAFAARRKDFFDSTTRGVEHFSIGGVGNPEISFSGGRASVAASKPPSSNLTSEDDL